jgi:hypothetical protein
MYCSRSSSRFPAHVPEPIRTAAEARALLETAISRPLRDETVAFLLDDAGHGRTIFVVAGTDRPESVLDVVEHLAAAGRISGLLSALVLASVRPGGGIVPGDIDRWFDASEIAQDHGVQLLEWFIYGPQGFTCPRDLLGEAERWQG